MLDQATYVPILRKRAAEIGAITNLLNEDFNNVTPFFEMCEHILTEDKIEKVKAVDPYEYLWKVIRELSQACGNRKYFIDFGYVEDVFNQYPKHAVEVFFELANFHSFHGLKPIPVTGIRRSNAHQNAVRSSLKLTNGEVCFRVSQKDIRETTFVPELLLLLRNLDLDPSDVHLLVDLEEINSASSSILEVCERIPRINEWLSFIVAGGAFPKFLSNLQKNEEHVLPRLDWKHWLKGFNERSRLKRLPIYSDYSVQFPKRPTPLNFRPDVSASIRYADLDSWIVMRGESLSKGEKSKQYWGLANALLHRDEYSGPDFSFADQYIDRIGSQTTETGYIMSWLIVAFNRHLTVASRQLTQLFSQPLQDARGAYGRMPRPPLPKAWNKKRLVLPESYRQQYLFTLS